ncbi:MAG: leucine-rich repeat protein, partial [Oscillospiraceae bacterium]|nr:leucine-rich repeat protein [Oscillospiraceae bacterium]
KMDDFSWGHYSDGTDAPWCVSYSDQIRKVVIQEGVTYIGAYAFYECENLTSILIPDGVTGIGERAFFGGGLKSIAIPDSVTGIGVGAFIRCTNLTEITIPNGVAKVENATFSGCKGLSSIEIPNSVVSIGAEAFSDCENLTEISIPDGVTSIGEMAFVDCAKLPQITIPNGVTCIGRDTFLRCSSLKEIEIPDSVEKIEYGAFQGCTNLSGILIPSSVTSIARAGEDGGVFDGDEKLTISGYSYTAAEVYAEDNDIPFISLGEATRDPSGVCDENLTWLVNVKTGTLTISGNGEVKYDTSWRTFNSCIRKIVIEDGVTGIGDWAFVGCDQLSSVVIANSIESIGDCAFSDCNNLTEIKIPSSVKFFGENSVGYYCTDPAWRKYAIVNGFTISGYPDTAAETYAKENDITFVSLAGLPLAEVTLAATTYTYSGTAKEPAVTVKDEKGNVLTKNQDYTVSYQDNINAGTASVTVTGTGEYTGTITKTFTINKADQTLTASISKPSILAGATASITANGIGTLSYTSGNTAVATVNASGVVTGTGAGTAIITVTAAGDSNYNAASKTVSVAVSCAAPVLISAVNANGGVQITWNKVTGAVLYRVFRKTSGSGWTKVGDTAATSYIDKTAVSNTTYTYTVRCIVSDGTAFTSAYDTVGKTVAYLSAPTLGSIANVSGGVQITWGKVTGAAKYRVFRKTAGSNWQVLGDTTGLIYTDKTAASGTAYTYTVRCVSANGKTFTSAYDPAGKTITYLSAPVLGAVANVSGGVQITWG